MKILRSLSIVAGMLLLTASLCAAQDAKGCKDSPLLTRFPGSVIDSCWEKPDDSLTFRVGNDRKTVEGEIAQINYNLPKGVSQAQLLRNLKTALTTVGYSLDYDSGNGDLTFHKGGTWVVIDSNMGGTFYHQTIVKESQLKQEMFASAAALRMGIASDGHMVARGIYFDTGKSAVKPESAPALREIVKLLRENPGLKLYVVGHTDNAGTLASNMELSRQRAAAVVEELKKSGVAASRLQAYGDGPYAPVASNDSAQGRAQNRRVELVKQ